MPMTSRERVEAALRHQAPDRTPVFEYVLLSPLADRLLGRAYAVDEQHWTKIVDALGWEGAVRQMAVDRLDLARLLGHDMMYVWPNPLPGEDATVAYKAVKWGANLAPSWVGNGVFLLTTLLGAYKARRKGKEFQVVAQSVDRGFRYLDKQKDLVVKAIKAKKYSHAIELLADAEGFNEVIGAFAKGSKLYESIKADVKKAKKKDN